MSDATPRSVPTGPDDMVALIQFSFAHYNSALDSLGRHNAETPKERAERKSRLDGTRIVPETMGVSLAGFAWQLEQRGFQLAGAFCKERLHGNREATYWFARFSFVRRAYRKHIPESFAPRRDAARDALSQLVHEAIWRVRAYRNPLSECASPVIGAHALSINCEVRTPLFFPDGKPVTAWRKDALGTKLGDAPIPIAPRYRLQLWDGNLGPTVSAAALPRRRHGRPIDRRDSPRRFSFFHTALARRIVSG